MGVEMTRVEDAVGFIWHLATLRAKLSQTVVTFFAGRFCIVVNFPPHKFAVVVDTGGEVVLSWHDYPPIGGKLEAWIETPDLMSSLYAVSLLDAIAWAAK